MKLLNIIFITAAIALFVYVMPSSSSSEQENSYSNELEQEYDWNANAKDMQDLRDSKTYEFYLTRDIITLMYSPDYEAWIMHSERHGELTDRTDDIHGLLKATEELSSLEYIEGRDYDNYIDIVSKHI